MKLYSVFYIVYNGTPQFFLCLIVKNKSLIQCLKLNDGNSESSERIKLLN